MVVKSSGQPSTRSRVEELFKRPNLEAEDVKVVVVKGVAYLDGAVTSYQQKKALASAVAALPAVREVANRLKVVPGRARGDGRIKESLLGSLKKDPVLSLYLIGVSVRDGVVELSGGVSRLSERIAAEALAWSVCGVRHVINRLVVVPEEALDSADLALAIKGSLEICLGLPGSAIDVHVEQGTARLTGSVATADQSLIAEDLVRYHPLIRRVVNELQVQEPARTRSTLRDLPTSA